MSAQILADVYKFLEGSLADSDMKDLDEEMRDEMGKELSGRFEAFMIVEIATHIASKDAGTLKQMHDQQRPKAAIDRYVKKHLANAGQGIANGR